jgi:hypothetical protein
MPHHTGNDTIDAALQASWQQHHYLSNTQCPWIIIVVPSGVSAGV